MKQLLLLVSISGLLVADDRSWFDQANALYTQDAVEPALQAYEHIQNPGPTVWYNMGNTFYKKADFLHARLYWLKAQGHGDLSVFTASTKNLMKLAQEGYGSDFNGIGIWFWWASHAVPLYIWQLLCLFAWYLFIVLLYKKKRLGYSSILGIISLVVTMMPLLAAYYYEKPKLLVMQETTVFNGPNVSLYQEGTIAPGVLVPYYDEQEGWYKIFHDSKVGWVQSEHVSTI